MRAISRVGVSHLLDRLLSFLLRELGEAPIFSQAKMHPILADRGQLASQSPIQIVDDARITLHVPISQAKAAARKHLSQSGKFFVNKNRTQTAVGSV
jgi:hypothetical protein